MKVLIAAACLLSLGLTDALSRLPNGPIGPIERFPIDPIRPRCGPVCRRFCPNGNVLNSRGCPTCRCKDGPIIEPFPIGPIKPPCGPVCAIFCPNGNVLDSRGCPTCRCKREGTCIKNGVTYSDGQTFKKDCNTCTCRNGFPLCTKKACLPDKCRRIKCRSRPCRNGYVYINGCRTCRCKPDKCPRLYCPKRLCRNGYVYKNGCKTCQCKPVRPCPKIRCLRKCPIFLSRKDSKGCPTCRCRFPFSYRGRPEI